jgi:hypothetical protein
VMLEQGSPHACQKHTEYVPRCCLHAMHTDRSPLAEHTPRNVDWSTGVAWLSFQPALTTVSGSQLRVWVYSEGHLCAFRTEDSLHPGGMWETPRSMNAGIGAARVDRLRESVRRTNVPSGSRCVMRRPTCWAQSSPRSLQGPFSNNNRSSALVRRRRRQDGRQEEERSEGGQRGECGASP